MVNCQNQRRSPCESVDWNLRTSNGKLSKSASLSLRERGLKWLVRVYRYLHRQVALLARAWIEMSTHPKRGTPCYSRSPCESVDWNPRTLKINCPWVRSLSLRERGLKCNLFINSWKASLVALLARAWIEINRRGKETHLQTVALLARAWIEISVKKGDFMRVFRRSPCESVDWNQYDAALRSPSRCRSPCESVDWNRHTLHSIILLSCRSPCESVDWNPLSQKEVLCVFSRSPCESVDWNN